MFLKIVVTSLLMSLLWGKPVYAQEVSLDKKLEVLSLLLHKQITCDKKERIWGRYFFKLVWDSAFFTQGELQKHKVINDLIAVFHCYLLTHERASDYYDSVFLSFYQNSDEKVPLISVRIAFDPYMSEKPLPYRVDPFTALLPNLDFYTGIDSMVIVHFRTGEFFTGQNAHQYYMYDLDFVGVLSKYFLKPKSEYNSAVIIWTNNEKSISTTLYYFDNPAFKKMFAAN